MPLSVTLRRFWAAPLAVVLTAILMALPAAAQQDPAVQFMDRVSRDLMAAQRTRSVQAMQLAISRHGDTQAIGLFALGDYRARLEPADREPYINGMTKFIGRYAATEAPKYPVAKIAFAPESRKAKYGITVDSTITLQDGTTYEIAWLLAKVEDYIGQNNGNVKALVGVLQRH
jgi:phospholipid transport system substrate-binding protein